MSYFLDYEVDQQTLTCPATIQFLYDNLSKRSHEDTYSYTATAPLYVGESRPGHERSLKPLKNMAVLVVRPKAL